MPQFRPPPRDSAASGIIAYSFQESDDGRFALVEFVARDRKAFAAILADARTDIKVFQKGRHTRTQIETEFRKFKRDFDPDSFGLEIGR